MTYLLVLDFLHICVKIITKMLITIRDKKKLSEIFVRLEKFTVDLK